MTYKLTRHFIQRLHQRTNIELLPIRDNRLYSSFKKPTGIIRMCVELKLDPPTEKHKHKVCRYLLLKCKAYPKGKIFVMIDNIWVTVLNTE